jgi:hypothetical protein
MWDRKAARNPRSIANAEKSGRDTEFFGKVDKNDVARKTTWARLRSGHLAARPKSPLILRHEL